MGLKSLKALLQSYSIVDLQKHIDSSISDSLLALNIRFTPKGLSEALVTCYGYGFFNHKKIRRMIIKNFTSQQFSTLLQDFSPQQLQALPNNRAQIIDDINNFSWGSNQKSLKILEILELNPDLFIQKK